MNQLNRIKNNFDDILDDMTYPFLKWFFFVMSAIAAISWVTMLFYRAIEPQNYGYSKIFDIIIVFLFTILLKLFFIIRDRLIKEKEKNSEKETEEIDSGWHKRRIRPLTQKK